MEHNANQLPTNPETGHELALNAAAQSEVCLALCFELPAPVEGQPLPATMPVVPAPDADGWIRGIDGRAWRMSDPAAVVAAYSRPRAITENHAGKLAAKAGHSAPAFGWIEKLKVSANGGIDADITWTPRGAAALNGREYRYFSPEMIFDRKTAEILGIAGGGLDNDPNFPQLALNSAANPEQHPMSLKLIAAALGLAETVDEAACVTAITTLKADRDTALNSAKTPDVTKFVPRAELELALNRANTAEGEVKTIKAAKHEADIVQALDDAQKAGKVIPAARDYYLALCRSEGGLESFKKLVSSLPVIAAPTATDKVPPVVQGGELTADELAICSATGISVEDFKKAKTA